MEYLVRFAQVLETFRKPEIEALASLANVGVHWVAYDECSPYCIVRLADEAAARALIGRSISSKGIYELWGSGSTYEELHADVRERTDLLRSPYASSSFRFDFDTYRSTRSAGEQNEIRAQFGYLGLHGPITMKSPDQAFRVFEEYEYEAVETPRRIYLGRWICNSQRQVINDYSLKKRTYISTTSMDSELAFLTANLSLAGPGKVFYDPFVGTGSFPVACSHFGAISLGSDIDGRMVRGKQGIDIFANFRQYGILGRYLDGFISDLTHSPLRETRFLDGIICDPPYGIREGLKVLGSRDGSGKEVIFIDGIAAYLQDEYIPPKRPYSFEAMLVNILDFAVAYLADNGRLSLWMPTANDEDVVLAIPSHHQLDLISICVQPFKKWSRRLLTYRRLPNSRPGAPLAPAEATASATGTTADDLNAFRKRYFQGFRSDIDEKGAPRSSGNGSKTGSQHVESKG